MKYYLTQNLLDYKICAFYGQGNIKGSYILNKFCSLPQCSTKFSNKILAHKTLNKKYMLRTVCVCIRERGKKRTFIYDGIVLQK